MPESSDLCALQGLDPGAQAALAASNLVLREDAFVDHAVQNRLSLLESSLGFFVVAGFDLGLDLFHVSTSHGTQACIVLAVLLVLTCALLGLRGICHRKTPENLKFVAE